MENINKIDGPDKAAAVINKNRNNAGNEFPKRKTLSEPPLLNSREAIRLRERDYYHRNRGRIRAKKREYCNKPEVKEKMRVHRKEYWNRPDVKERLRAYRQRPDQKRKRIEYYRRNKARIQLRERERLKHPEVWKKLLGYYRAYGQRPYVKIKRGEYRERHREDHRAYMRAYRKRPYVREKTRARLRGAGFKKRWNAYRREYFRRPDANKRRREEAREYRRRHRRALAARRKILQSTPEARAKRKEYIQRPDARIIRRLNARGYWKYHLNYIRKHQKEINAQHKARHNTPKIEVRERRYQRIHREFYSECEPFMDDLFSQNSAKVTDAILALGVRKFKPARKEFIRRLRSGDRYVRMAALSALGVIGDPRSTQAVADIVLIAERSHDGGLLREALMALGRLKNRDALRVIKRFLHDPDKMTRECAERACWLSFDPSIGLGKYVPTFSQRPLPPSLARYLERL